MKPAKILVIDDEESILDLVTAYLSQGGYEYRTARDGPAGLDAALNYGPDLVVLDINLPGMDGIEVLSQIRRESDVYIIMLTAKAEETDKVIGLSVGADDYLTKPFSPRELMARIKAALRRVQHNNEPRNGTVILAPSLRIDPTSRQVWVDNKLVDLTYIEFELLLTLAEYRGMVLTREQLLEKVWGYDYFGETRVVDVHLGHVRQKLGENHNIATVRGIGYRFEKEQR